MLRSEPDRSSEVQEEDPPINEGDWAYHFEVYSPVILGVARGHGLSADEAEEVATGSCAASGPVGRVRRWAAQAANGAVSSDVLEAGNGR
jgi:hypothetical protein